MHFNRKKISQAKLKISPNKKRRKRKKKSKEDIFKVIRPVIRQKNKKIKVVSSALNNVKFNDQVKYKSMSEWRNLLKGEVAFLLGNSPSISKQKLELLEPYFTIGVNRIFYIFAPTILMWQDIQMWNREKKDIVKQKSIRVCTKISDPRDTFLHFKIKQGGFKFDNNPNIFNGTGNSGIIAAQLAVNLGCSALVILGMDCKYTKKYRTDFYGRNRDHKPYTLEMCREAMETLRNVCPVPVYSCCKNKLWKERKLSDVIKILNPKKRNRKQYIEIFKLKN